MLSQSLPQSNSTIAFLAVVTDLSSFPASLLQLFALQTRGLRQAAQPGHSFRETASPPAPCSMPASTRSFGALSATPATPGSHAPPRPPFPGPWAGLGQGRSAGRADALADAGCRDRRVCSSGADRACNERETDTPGLAGPAPPVRDVRFPRRRGPVRRPAHRKDSTPVSRRESHCLRGNWMRRCR